MKLDLDLTVKNMDGTDYMEGGKVLSFKDIFMFSLLSMPEEKRKQCAPQADKIKCYKLCQKINNKNDETDFDLDEIIILKKIGVEMMPVLVAGQISDFLEGAGK